ncbi:MAG: enoyl-CoA hydratase/isomerase family protein, partial [Chloroflexi bacterium]|nr:enoyl-CoA hydratase/isomerase family protein [Chloroflexota bacterium]
MQYKNIIFEKKNRIAKITLNRPKELNSIDMDTHLELQAALTDSEKDPEIRVVVITGAGRAFCAGADLKSAVALNDKPQ